MTNMRIWDALKTTDPRHTKEVGFGRKFTSIDAQWQLQRMTEQFGPVGEGWGYTCEHSVLRLADDLALAIVDVTIWWGKEREASVHGLVHPQTYGPIRAAAPLWEATKEGKMRLDDDAPKKAMTDALTKGLSHLGLSADVFLGMYDDNKYVAKLKAEFAKEAQASGADADVTDAASRWVSSESGVLTGLVNAEDVKAWRTRNLRALNKLAAQHPDLHQKIMDAYDLALDRVRVPV